MKFPDLFIGNEERDKLEHIGELLVDRLRSFFNQEYGVCPSIKVSGSTQKGTALPERFFGVDLDTSVKTDDDLLAGIAYRSSHFEGCQLFSLDFFLRFSHYFEEVYFAGHRLSGKFNGYDFDFAIADEKKDSWKWDFNGSKYLTLSTQQVLEIQKVKFFLKTFNVSGSEVYGIVGPAAELGIYHHGSFEQWLNIIQEIPPMIEDFDSAFATHLFPSEFYAMFPSSDDYIHIGLVDSFRYTTPITFNRLLDAANSRTLNLQTFMRHHTPPYTYVRRLPTSHYRLIAYILGLVLKGKEYFHIDILIDPPRLVLCAHATKGEATLLNDAFSTIERLHGMRELDVTIHPAIEKDVASKIDAPNTYTFFIGKPALPMRENIVYVPFDFLVRSDAIALIKVMEEGQCAK